MTDGTDVGANVRTLGAIFTMVVLAGSGFAYVRNAVEALPVLETRVTGLEAKVTGLETKVTGLETKVTDLTEVHLPNAWRSFSSFSREYTLTLDRESGSEEMLSVGEGFCFITAINGPLDGEGESVEINETRGRWVLSVKTDRKLSVSARCWLFPTLHDQAR